MNVKRSLKLPITLGVVMIVLVVLLVVGWVLLAVYAAQTVYPHATLFWVLLPIGTVFLAALLAGVIVYLVLSIKIINLNRRQTNFVDSVTHELKSPLASMKLSLQTLAKYEVSPAEKEAFYSGLLEELERLEALVNQVLRAGQLEAGLRIADSPEDVAVRDVLHSAIHFAAIRYRVPDSSVDLHCGDERMFVSRIPLEMVLRNLIDNAVKYAGDPPQVRVRVRNSEKGMMFWISDNGPGIPPEMRHKVFKRFVRLGTELERRRTGTGLGLYIVRMCLLQLNGRVRIRSPKRPRGTVFFVFIPHIPVQMPEIKE